MSDSKRLDEWTRRGLEMERLGLEPGVIGTKDRIRRLAERVRAGSCPHQLTVRSGKTRIRMSVVGPTQVGSRRISLGIVFDIPPRGRARKSVDKAVALLATFVKDALVRNSKRHPPPSRRG